MKFETFKRMFTLAHQKGYIQKLVTLVVYIILAFVFVGVLQWLWYGYLFKALDAVLPQFLESSQEIPAVKEGIRIVVGDIGIKLALPLLLAITALFFLLKASTWLMLTAGVTLNQAIRYLDAMERVGLRHDHEQLQFIRIYKLPLYVADQPLATPEAIEIQAHPYLFAHNPLFSKRFMNEKIGTRQLCFKMADVDGAIEKLRDALNVTMDSAADREAVKELRRKVLELEQEKAALNKHALDSAGAIEELSKENKKLSNDMKGMELRDAKKKKAEQAFFLYSTMLSQIFQRLMEGRHEPRDFTKSALNDLFSTYLKENAQARQQLFSVAKTHATTLPENVGDAIWETLKTFNLVSPGGPPPSGNLDRLKEIVFAPKRL